MRNFLANALSVLRGWRALAFAAALAATASLSISLAYEGPHPYVVVHRVSAPYGAPWLGGWVVAVAWVVLALSVLTSLLALKHHAITAAPYALLAVCCAGCVAALIPSLSRVAYVVLSLYCVGIPASIALLPLACAASVALAACLAVRLLTRRVRTLSTRVGPERRLLSSIPLSEAALMFFTSLVILLVPYYPWVNPHGVLADVDHIYYMRWLRHASWANLPQALVAFDQCDRPLFLLLIFLITRLIPFRVFDVLYIAGFGALLTVLAERITRSAGLAKYSGFVSSLLFSIPLYFVYGGYHANLLALTLCYAAVAVLFKALRSGGVSSRTMALLAMLSAATVLTHSEAWVLFTPLMLVGARPAVAWVLPGAAWLAVRKLVFSPMYAKLAHNLLSKGVLTLHSLKFQLTVMLWGVPATWLSYAFAVLGAALLMLHYLRSGGEASVIPELPAVEPRTLLSAALSAIPAFAALFLVTPKFLLHRLVMNSFLWFFTAYALSYLLTSRKLKPATLIFIGLQSLYVFWLLVNTIPLLL